MPDRGGAPADPRLFIRQQQRAIQDFCERLDEHLPSYSYVPLSTDEQRVLVMQSRLYNELRAAEVFGAWLASTPDLEIKRHLADACHEEMQHAELLERRIEGMGAKALDYGPPPEQVALFHTMQNLETISERLAAFQLAGEAVAAHLIRRALAAETVPEWIRAPYRRIIEDEAEHGSEPARMLERYATTGEQQRLVRRGVSLGLSLRQRYFDALDEMVFSGVRW